MPFIKATPSAAKIRMALVGPSGSGKTYTALRIARGLAGPDGKIGLADSEAHSASIYARKFDFSTLPIETAHPNEYIKAIEEADKTGLDVLIIDSLSHAWIGREGALALVDAGSKRSQGNKFVAWGDVTPLQNNLLDAIKSAKCHIICTMRAKTEYVLEPGPNGKMAPRKVGLGPVQRDGIEFEFNLMAMLDGDHNLIVSNTRYEELDQKVIPRAGEEFGGMLLKLLDVGTARAASEPVSAKPKPAKPSNGAKREESQRAVEVEQNPSMVMKPPAAELARSEPVKADADKPWAKWQQIQMAKFAEKLGFPSDDARHEFIMAALKVPDGFTWDQVKAGMTMEQASVAINAMRAAIAAKPQATTAK